MLVDSPAALAVAATASVRRWQLAQIVKFHPELLPAEDDVTHTVLPEARPQLSEFYAPPSLHKLNDLSARLPQSVVNLAPVLGKLLQGKCSRTRMVHDWTPSCRPWLLSLVSGGQWPQARVAQAAGADASLLCQLCLQETGTLAHRRCCLATRPDAGWPTMKVAERKFVDGLSADRKRLLEDNGLLLLRAKVTKQRPGGWFRWLKQPPADIPDSASWYVDGSLVDGPSRLLGVTGFAIVVVAEDGSLLGCAHGAPPAWVATAGAAEAFALYKVLAVNPFVPTIVTDCLGVLQTLQRGSTTATAANRVNARLWRLIASCLDGTTWREAAEQVTWMPAHGSRAAIGVATKSNNDVVSETDWRANRLADALAKAAASRFRVPQSVRRVVATAMRAYEHSAAVAGLVTKAANNHFVSATLEDGSYAYRKVRDSLPPAKHKTSHETPANAPAGTPTATATSSTSSATPGPPNAAPPRASSSARAALQKTEALKDARFIQTWHKDMAAQPRAAASGMSGRERIEALKLRIRLKALAGT